MSLSSKLSSILDHVKTELAGATDAAGAPYFAEVHIGTKERVDNFPSAFVILSRYECETRALAPRYFYNCTISIIIVVRDISPEQGLKDGITLSEVVKDMVVSDPTLGGNALSSDVIRFEYSRTEGRIHHWFVTEIGVMVE